MNEIPGEAMPQPKERGDLADPKKVGRKALMERLQDQQERDDVMFILSSVQGRRFYWRLMKECGIFKSSYSAENGRIFFYEGERNIGLMLMNDLNQISPESYLQMIKEAKYEESKKS